ncbi:MAG: hypothetical protein N0A16_00850 [Blastocatellia bacterium]|nr:hypothetical protein [Blastocatellia bacterium]MCS7156261.1 hypothetical protein [Blastocatellia bacterium]MCX7751389.1 hypothetical protein [Blastocatellia bacterium]MDW8169102.1 hypothetical protein [Acidobacteriota bacterium]MDW8255806.1 hypothetical protein [Acidobacteriota bacterium]
MRILVFVLGLGIGGVLLGAHSGISSPFGGGPQSPNSCVNCHQGITAPLELSQRYYDWHLSIHKEKGVTCDACHGGDPQARAAQEAHRGVFPSFDERSRVYGKNQIETCGVCHREVRTAYATSAHYLKLSSAGLGPFCSTCHPDMANATVRSATDIGALCNRCHGTEGGLLPPNPQIVKSAQETLLSLSRANGVIIWADRLVEAAQEKRLDVSGEIRDLEVARKLLAEAKWEWHAFRFEPVRTKANRAFEQGTKVKDRLMQKVYPGPRL